MISFAIPQTRWTRRVWVYLGFTSKAILGKLKFVEFIEDGEVIDSIGLPKW